jgi:ABC-type phosphate transport system permease subunit
MKLHKSKKAIAPIVAELLLIVVAVAAGLIVYAWSSGFITTQTNKAGEMIQVNTVVFQKTYSTYGTKGNFTAYVQNAGTISTRIISIAISNSTWSTDNTITPVSISQGTLQPVSSSLGTSPTSGCSYTFKVTTVDGVEGTGTFVAP